MPLDNLNWSNFTFNSPEKLSVILHLPILTSFNIISKLRVSFDDATELFKLV